MAPKLHLPFPYCLVSLHFNGAAVPNGATSTFGVLPTDTSTPAQIATVIKTQLRAAGGPFGSTALNNPFTTSILLQDVTVKQGPLDTGPEAAASDGAQLGTQAAPVAPSLAVLITKNTAQGGKRGRGRMFVPGLASNVALTGGQIQASSVTAMQSAWTQLLTGLQTAGIGMSLLHTYDTAKGQSPISPTTITGLTVNSLLATQRNRMRR